MKTSLVRFSPFVSQRAYNQLRLLKLRRIISQTVFNCLNLVYTVFYSNHGNIECKHWGRQTRSSDNESQSEVRL